MSKLNYYDIRLTPQDRFFFGGEIVFGQDGDTDERRRSYLIHSRVLPQQTSLLGMLRYELLRANQRLAPYPAVVEGGTDKRAEAIALAGSTGFQYDKENPALNDYGCIKAISPLLLRDDDGDTWYPVPVDEGKNKDKKYSWVLICEKYWKLNNYDAKEGITHAFAAGDYGKDEDAYKAVGDIFQDVALTGNRISNRHSRPDESSEGDEEGLFRQTYYANKEGKKFSFTFRIAVKGDCWEKLRTDTGNEGAAAGAGNVDGSIGNTPKIHRVTLGGEHSIFSMEVRSSGVSETEGVNEFLNVALLEFAKPKTLYRLNTGPLPKTKTPANSFTRIVFLSDVYLPEEILAKCEDQSYFLIAETTPFRYLSSSLDRPSPLASVRWYGSKEEVTTHNQNKNVKGPLHGRRRESAPTTLYRRGGVMIVPATDAKTVVSAIHQIAPFHQIGYNYCTHE